MELLEEYFAAAGNDDLTIVIFPEAGHSLNDFMPAYWEALYAWIESLQASWNCEDGEAAQQLLRNGAWGLLVERVR